jgi:hypothetical protein
MNSLAPHLRYNACMRVAPRVSGQTDGGRRGRPPPVNPQTRLTRKNTRKMKNSILAIPAALAANPPKPNKAATSEITRNMSVHRSIITSIFRQPEIASPTGEP